MKKMGLYSQIIIKCLANIAKYSKCLASVAKHSKCLASYAWLALLSVVNA
jgi:hypothetical protein